MNDILNGMPLSQLIIMISPILILQTILIIFSLIQLKKHGVKNFNEMIWLLIILFVNTLGPILFLLFGRKTDDYS